MVFSSTVFLFLFLPVVLALYAAAPRPAHNGLLLAASLLFYAWGEGGFVLLMLASIGLNWLFGLLVDAYRGRAAERAIAVAAIATNLGLLAAFKYANFLVDNANVLLAGLALPTLQLAPVHLPIGISFFTFQALSYVIDVRRGDTQVQRNPFDLALYVALFPQLIAGPIVRYRDVADQIRTRAVDAELFASGVNRFTLGLGKKMLIANAVAAPADRVFGLPVADLTPGLAWLGVVCYALQIYFDFSGYSDMAIGLGRMFGFRFLENFQFPYIARSVTEFWRRWHISLSTWFRDYLYIPLGGSRGPRWMTYRNLVLVFLLCGLWHGAAWGFVVWGLWHGAFLILERMGFAAGLEHAPRPLRHAYLLLVVLVGWVFFRAETLPFALSYLSALAGFSAGSGVVIAASHLLDGTVATAIAAGIIGSLPLFPWIEQRIERARARAPSVPREAALALGSQLGLAAILILSAATLASGTHNPFIYFRF